MKEVIEKIQRAYSVVERKTPYLVGGVRSMKLIPSKAVSTAATNPFYVCRYNEKFFLELSTEQVAAVLVHEFLHPFLNHHVRTEDRDVRKANIAKDASINCILILTGYTLPAHAILPEMFGLSNQKPKNWEVYYEYVKNFVTDDKDMFPVEVMSGSCGSCTDESLLDEEHEHTGEEQDEQEKREDIFRKHSIDAEVTEKIIEQNKAGKLNAFLSEVFNRSLYSDKIDWKVVLRDVVVNAASNVKRGASGMSLNNVVRALLPYGIVLSGPIDKNPEIVVIVDTSGSMWSKEIINECLGVTFSILKRMNLPYVWFFEADVVSKRVPIKVKTKDLDGIRLEGGGGTSFIEPLQLAEKLKVDIIIYISDGVGSYPPKPPKQKVIWALLKSNAYPPFGKIVRIN